jgi:hypothetical protein
MASSARALARLRCPAACSAELLQRLTTTFHMFGGPGPTLGTGCRILRGATRTLDLAPCVFGSPAPAPDHARRSCGDHYSGTFLVGLRLRARYTAGAAVFLWGRKLGGRSTVRGWACGTGVGRKPRAQVRPPGVACSPASRVSLLSAPAGLRFAPVRRNRPFQPDSACRRLPTAPVAPLLGQKPATYPRRPRNRRGRQDNPYRPVSFRSPVKHPGRRSCALAPAARRMSKPHANSTPLDVIELFRDPRCPAATGSGASPGSPPTFLPTGTPPGGDRHTFLAAATWSARSATQPVRWAAGIGLPHLTTTDGIFGACTRALAVPRRTFGRDPPALDHHVSHVRRTRSIAWNGLPNSPRHDADARPGPPRVRQPGSSARPRSPASCVRWCDWRDGVVSEKVAC